MPVGNRPFISRPTSRVTSITGVGPESKYRRLGCITCITTIDAVVGCDPLAGSAGSRTGSAGSRRRSSAAPAQRTRSVKRRTDASRLGIERGVRGKSYDRGPRCHLSGTCQPRFTGLASAQPREVMLARGYLSQVERTLTFGLGRSTSVERLRIHWTDGTTRDVAVPQVDREMRISKPAMP